MKTTNATYQVRAYPHVLANGTVNDGSLAGVKFRVRSTYERDAVGKLVVVNWFVNVTW
jgi:hypothetical protein